VYEIGLVEVSGGGESSLAMSVSYEGEDAVALRFLLSMTGEKGLEAVRYARRSLLREERTRGRQPDEPSLEDAVFSAREILWVVRPEQRRWCLEKLEELRRRANRLLTDMEPG
jgi:hypothetical protein